MATDSEMILFITHFQFPLRAHWLNPLSPGIKLQILLLCFHTFLSKVVGEAVKISIEFNLNDYVLNSHDLPN